MKKLLALFAIAATLSLYSCDEKKGDGDADHADSTEVTADTTKMEEAAPADTTKEAAPADTTKKAEETKKP